MPGVCGLLILALAAEAGSGASDRILLCRPQVLGSPALARSEALVAASRKFGALFLDYGVQCQGTAEAARAAARFGLAHAVASTAEGRPAGSRYVLDLTGPIAPASSRIAVEVLPEDDPVAPLGRGLERILSLTGKGRAPEPSGRHRVAPWVLVGAGVVALAVGGGLALKARSVASARDAAAPADPASYVQRDHEWRRWRTASGVALGVGGAAVTAGLVWRFAF